MAKQHICDKFRQREAEGVKTSTFECPVVSCNMTRLAMIRESYSQLRLPIWEDAIRLQQRIGKRSLLEMLSCSPTPSNTLKDL